MLSWVLACLPALAAPAVPLDPALPLRTSAGRWEVRAFGLPPMIPAEGAEDGRLRCRLQLDLEAEGPATVEVLDCAEGWAAAAREAAEGWRFAPVGEPVAARAELHFVQRVDGRLGSTAVWAELDPGPEHPDLEGRPGLKLVRPATLSRPLPARLPGRLRGGGLAGQACEARVRVGEDGRVRELELGPCPDDLTDHARRQVARARFEPASVDGQLREDIAHLTLRFTDGSRDSRRRAPDPPAEGE